MSLISNFFLIISVLLCGNNAIANSTSELDKFIEAYFDNFEPLTKSESWEKILNHGLQALDAAKASARTQDEAKICAQLASTSFYQGDYSKALNFVNRCHQLAEAFDDPSFLLRSLYLESSVHRALGGKSHDEHSMQNYARAVEIANVALKIYPLRRKTQSLRTGIKADCN